MCYCRLAMTRPRLTLFACGGLLCAALAAGGCRRSSPDLISFPLVYTPSSKVDPSKTMGLAPLPPGTLVFIAQIVDKRQVQDGNVLGLSEEADPDAPVYNAPGGQVPTEFVRNVLARELATLGFAVTADPVAATHTLQLQLDQFWINEGNVYQGNVAGQVWLIDRTGTTRWQGPFAGKSSRWGRSVKTENFREALSDATLDSAMNLATNNELRAAFAVQ